MKPKSQKRISVAFALAFIVGCIIGTTFLVQTGIIFFSGAAPSDNPHDVRITNISDTAATITYTTEAKVIGTVSFGQDKNSLKTILDERDQQSGIPQQYRVHSISMKTLQPNTDYIFSITSGTTTYMDHNAYFTIHTAPAMTGLPTSQNPVTGKLVSSDGTNPQEALVFLSLDNGQILSTLANATGVYTIPLNTYRTKDVQNPFTFPLNAVVHLLATNADSSSQATVFLAGSNPVPLITLSQTYNFTHSLQPVASESAEASIGFPAFSSSNTLDATPVIITPKKDETFTDAQPRFTGKALPDETVTIEIHSSDVITGTTTTDASGNWSFRPQQPLAPGSHTLTVITKGASGILHSIEQSFTVYAAGSQLDQSAVPSGTPTNTPTPTPTPSPTATPTPTVAPTVTKAPSPTALPTIQPTSKPTIQVSITPKPSLPPTGSNALVTAGTTGIVTTVIGIVLFFISRGAAL